MKHRKGCTLGWDGSCVESCPFHPSNQGSHRFDRIREYSGVETPLREKAEARGWRALKFVSPGLRGVPDRMVLKGLGAAMMRYQLAMGCSTETAERDIRMLIADVIEFVELKAPDKEATLQQLRRHAELQKLGFATSVLDTPAAVEKWYADRP